MKIIVADLAMKGREHIFFNSAMIKMLNMITSAEIRIYADKEHCCFLEKELNAKNLLIPIKILSHRLWRCLFSDIFSCIQVLRILLKTKRSDCVILLNRLPLTLLTYNLFNLFFKRKTVSILHGELESIVNYVNVSGLTKYYYMLFLLGYICSNKHMSYVALGDSILREIKNVNFGRAKLFSIDHPYDYSNKVTPNSNFQTLKFGIIGSAMKRKNSQLIFELAEKYNGAICEKKHKIFFAIAGTIDKNVESYANEHVEYDKTKVMYSSEEYAEKISMIHYSLQFYDSYTNRALASGSFFDSFKYEKPMLTLKGNPFVDYYFDLFGDIGFQFDNIDSMVRFLINHDFNQCEYLNQVQNIRKAKEKLKLDNIALILQQELQLC